jgi:hypothetical protein
MTSYKKAEMEELLEKYNKFKIPKEPFAKYKELYSKETFKSTLKLVRLIFNKKYKSMAVENDEDGLNFIYYFIFFINQEAKIVNFLKIG